MYEDVREDMIPWINDEADKIIIFVSALALFKQTKPINIDKFHSMAEMLALSLLSSISMVYHYMQLSKHAPYCQKTFSLEKKYGLSEIQ